MKKFITRILCATLVVAATLALAACSKAETPLTAAELLDLGEKYLLELDYEQALVQFLSVIEVDPMNPRGYTGVAEAYIGLGDADSAEAVLRNGLEALPNNAEIVDMARKLGIDVGVAQTPRPTPTPTPAPIDDDDGDYEVIEFGGYDWRVLDRQGGRALIISEDILENRRYHRVSYTFWWGDEAVESEVIPEDAWKDAVTWATSDVRTYLNGEFLSSFSEVDRARIADTNVINNDNPWTFSTWDWWGRSDGGWDGSNTPGGAIAP